MKIRKFEGVTFYFDSDFSGDVVVSGVNVDTSSGSLEVRIPAQAILDLVAREYVLPETISRLEEATTRDLLVGRYSQDAFCEEYDEPPELP